MAIDPAATSASPAVIMTAVLSTAPDSPAASANGTVKPSDMPMTISRTVSDAVKCFSIWGVCGICSSLSYLWLWLISYLPYATYHRLYRVGCHLFRRADSPLCRNRLFWAVAINGPG